MPVVTPSAAGATTRYHEEMAVTFPNRSLQTSRDVHLTPRLHSTSRSARPRGALAKLGLLLLLCAASLLALVACTDTAGLGETSSGWSPVVAVAIPTDTGVAVNQTRNVDPLDTAITVTDSTRLDPGQVIQLGGERMRVTAIREQQLVVVRGVDGTTPTAHSGQERIFAIGDSFTVFVATKQGGILALQDDGLGDPRIQWSAHQDQGDR